MDQSHPCKSRSSCRSDAEAISRIRSYSTFSSCSARGTTSMLTGPAPGIVSFGTVAVAGGGCFYWRTQSVSRQLNCQPKVTFQNALRELLHRLRVLKVNASVMCCVDSSKVGVCDGKRGEVDVERLLRRRHVFAPLPPFISPPPSRWMDDETSEVCGRHSSPAQIVLKSPSRLCRNKNQRRRADPQRIDGGGWSSAHFIHPKPLGKCPSATHSSATHALRMTIHLGFNARQFS